ncbi:MAG TPA: class I SAM-dependent methyltransferase [Nevskiales bacterium]|nr:class I SAM-dependent methyltransferase [Nevskiales bacterium]
MPVTNVTVQELLAAFQHQEPFQPATNFWRAIEVATVLSHGLPSGRGLDLGCGNGRLTKIILNHVGRRVMVGIDLDPEETRLAIGEGIYSRVHTCSATHIPEPSGSFDFVFSNSVLEHIEPIQDTLKEVSRLLRPGGRFLFTVPSNHFHSCLPAPNAPEQAMAYFETIDKRCAHLRYWTLDEWCANLNNAGLGIEYFQDYMTPREVSRWVFLSNMTSGILYKLYLGKKRPIEIQRALGGRRSSLHMPMLLAAFSAKIMSLGVVPDHNHKTHLRACLLIEAVRRQ